MAFNEGGIFRGVNKFGMISDFLVDGLGIAWPDSLCSYMQRAMGFLYLPEFISKCRTEFGLYNVHMSSAQFDHTHGHIITYTHT